MKIVAAYSTPVEAHLAKSRLISSGIEANVRDEFTVTFDWLLSNAVGGVKLEVDDDDFPAALTILTMKAPEEGLISCPHCGSHDSTVRTLTVFGALCIFLKIPIPMKHLVADCRQCGKSSDVRTDGWQADKSREIRDE